MHLFLQEKMDLDELESWYDEQKERLFEKLKKDSEKDKKKAELDYKNEMKKTREKYNKNFEKIIGQDAKPKKK